LAVGAPGGFFDPTLASGGAQVSDDGQLPPVVSGGMERGAGRTLVAGNCVRAVFLGAKAKFDDEATWEVHPSLAAVATPKQLRALVTAAEAKVGLIDASPKVIAVQGLGKAVDPKSAKKEVASPKAATADKLAAKNFAGNPAVSGGGFVDFDELLEFTCGALATLQRKARVRLARAFISHDSDHDGRMTFPEFRRLIAAELGR